MSVYDQVGALKPGRTAFDLSHTKVFDCSIGELVPVLFEEVLPGDIFEMSMANVVRSSPLVVPIYTACNIYVHYYFMPTRLIFDAWPKFISGGASGDETVSLPRFADGIQTDTIKIQRYGLWDQLGLPIHDGGGMPETEMELSKQGVIGDFVDVLDFPWRVYWSIWRDYYRDETLQQYYPEPNGAENHPVGETDEEKLQCLETWLHQGASQSGDVLYFDRLAYRCYKKDYFTSALPWQQRGTSPAIPIEGTTSAQWDLNLFMSYADPTVPSNMHPIHFTQTDDDNEGAFVFGDSATGTGATAGDTIKGFRNFLNSNQVDFTASGVDISELRFAIQVQKWMERNARAGYRYNEFLQAHFGVNPRDERLQRPEYIGGCYQPLIISETLQNSETTANSPQGNMAGHGMSVSEDFIGKYRAQEHGYIMAIMSIVPETIYQQGIPRMFTRETKYDFYSPEFAHLSEQEIRSKEVFWTNEPTYDNSRFGFQGAFDEYRTRNSIVSGQMACDQKDWTLSRIFDNRPVLNADFLTLEQLSKNRRDAWAVPGVVGGYYGQFIIQWRNRIKAIRPMPYIPDPGLMDHF